jgi:hypothetical protein
MKTRNQKQGKGKAGQARFSLRLLAAILALGLLCGACSGRHSAVAPYEMGEDGLSLIDESGYEEQGASWEGTEEPAGVAASVQAIGGQVFGVADLLFSAVDSLNAMGK